MRYSISNDTMVSARVCVRMCKRVYVEKACTKCKTFRIIENLMQRWKRARKMYSIFSVKCPYSLFRRCYFLLLSLFLMPNSSRIVILSLSYSMPCIMWCASLWAEQINPYIRKHLFFFLSCFQPFFFFICFDSRFAHFLRRHQPGLLPSFSWI